MIIQRASIGAPASRLPISRSLLISRSFSIAHVAYSDDKTTVTETPQVSPRWLSDAKARIGKCITFGMSPDLVDKAGGILKEISSDWRDLVAGSEGYLVDKKRAGLHRHAIVWGEQDTMGHVNNVMYVRYAESARTNWTRSIGQHFDRSNRRLWEELLSSKGVGLILKSITVDFKFPMTWPDRISVYHKLRHEPDKSTQSMILDVVILSEAKQRPAARCLEDVVVYNYKQSKKTALPPFMLEQFQQIWKLQETAKSENLKKLKQIEQKIKDLEINSWDRPDAKEDFGSAA